MARTKRETSIEQKVQVLGESALAIAMAVGHILKRLDAIDRRHAKQDRAAAKAKARKAAAVKRKNPQDATLRNIRALKADVKRLRAYVNLAHQRIGAQKTRVDSIETTAAGLVKAEHEHRAAGL